MVCLPRPARCWGGPGLRFPRGGGLPHRFHTHSANMSDPTLGREEAPFTSVSLPACAFRGTAALVHPSAHWTGKKSVKEAWGFGSSESLGAGAGAGWTDAARPGTARRAGGPVARPCLLRVRTRCRSPFGPRGTTPITPSDKNTVVSSGDVPYPLWPFL